MLEQERKRSELRDQNLEKSTAIREAYQKKIAAYKYKHPITCSEDKKARQKYVKVQTDSANHKFKIRENTYDHAIHDNYLETKFLIAKKFTNIIKLKKNRKTKWQ